MIYIEKLHAYSPILFEPSVRITAIFVQQEVQHERIVFVRSLACLDGSYKFFRSILPMSAEASATHLMAIGNSSSASP